MLELHFEVLLQQFRARGVCSRGFEPANPSSFGMPRKCWDPQFLGKVLWNLCSILLTLKFVLFLLNMLWILYIFMYIMGRG